MLARNSSVSVSIYLLAAAVVAIGIGSLLVFGLFLWRGEFELVHLGLPWYGALLWDALLCLAFFAQHSIMVRKSFDAWLARFIPAYFHRAIYTVASGAVLLLLALCWQLSHTGVVVAGGAGRLVMRVVLLAAMAVFVWAIFSLREFDAFGVEAMLAHFRAKQPDFAPLTVRGPYRWIRHPFYSSGIVAIWACPALSADRLLFNVLFTIWMVAGAHLEERDLAVDFGDSYRAYQRQVPMLLPWRRPSAALDSSLSTPSPPGYRKAR